jgi:hypothetical protein
MVVAGHAVVTTLRASIVVWVLRIVGPPHGTAETVPILGFLLMRSLRLRFNVDRGPGGC